MLGGCLRFFVGWGCGDFAVGIGGGFSVGLVFVGRSFISWLAGLL